MKTVFFATPDFAVKSLEALIDRHEVLAVVTQPDKPKGRGRKMLFSPVKEFALKNNIKVFQPVKVSEIIQQLETLGADIFVVAAYGQLLPEKILNMPKFGCINVHASLLPKYRGAAPIQRAIIEGEKKTGITIMYMKKELDCGDMILKKELSIEPEDTFGTLHDKMAPLGASALTEALELFENGNVNAQKQNDDEASYASKITKQTAYIDWSKTSAEIKNLIRGLNPSPCAYTYYNDETFKIWEAEEVKDKSYCAAAGEIVDVSNKNGFVVKTGDSALNIIQIQAKGGKKMNTADYMRGHKIEKGMFLK